VCSILSASSLKHEDGGKFLNNTLYRLEIPSALNHNILTGRGGVETLLL
jgi:hypothetical protein